MPEISPVVVVFVVLIALSLIRGFFEWILNQAAEAERVAKLAQQQARQREAEQRAGMPAQPEGQPRARARARQRQPQAQAPQRASQPQVRAQPAPRRPDQPIALEEILRQMMGEPPAPQPQPAPRPAPPAPRPAPQPVVVEDDRHHVDVEHIQERTERIRERLTNKVADRVLHSGLKADDRIALTQADPQVARDVLREIDRLTTPLQKMVVYSELMGRPPGLQGPRVGAPSRGISLGQRAAP